jgi:hypothetical protein
VLGLDHYIGRLIGLNTKKIGAEALGELRIVVLKENGEGEMATT